MAIKIIAIFLAKYVIESDIKKDRFLKRYLVIQQVILTLFIFISVIYSPMSPPSLYIKKILFMDVIVLIVLKIYI